MAVDAFAQRSILGVMQALFDATPGAGLNDICVQALEQGISLPLLATILTRTPAFNSRYLYAETLSTTAFATQFVNDLIGNRAAQSDKNTLASTISGKISTGLSRDAAMSSVFEMLSTTADDHAVWGRAAAQYKREVSGIILDNLLGGSAVVQTLKADLAQVMADILAHDGAALGSLVVYLVSALDAIPETEPVFGDVVRRFHNKLEVSGYYSLNLAQPGSSMDELKSVIAPVDEQPLTVALAKMKADYFTAHAPYAVDALVVTSSLDLTGIDTSAYTKLIVDAGAAQSLPRAAVIMTAAQAAAFSAVTKGAGDTLAVVDTLANITAQAGLLANADSLTGLVTASVNLTQADLTRVTGLIIDNSAHTGIKVTVNAAQAASLASRLSKGSGDTLAVVDSVANINAASNLSAADTVTGVVSASADLANTSLEKLTDLAIGVPGGAAVSLTMWAAQAELLKGRIAKAPGSTLTLYVVPSEISSIPDMADAIIANVTITRDLRGLDLSKCIALKISDGTSAGIYATLLAAQAQRLAGRVTKGISDKLVVDDTPGNVVAATDLSVADMIYATDLSGAGVTIAETDLVRITELRTAGLTTLNNATSAGIAQSVAKIVLSGGALLVNAAAGNIAVPFAAMTKISGLTAQPDYTITLTDAKNNGLSATISRLHVSGSGQLKIIGAAGENITIAGSDLALVTSLLAAPGAQITFTGATGAGLVADLAKLTVSGGGKISVLGEFDESFSIDEAVLLPLKSLTAQGSGSISVTGVHNANLAAVLAAATMTGGGTVRISGAALEDLTISKTALDAEPVSSVEAAAGQSITLSGATAATLAADMAKLHVSGAGKIYVTGAANQSFVLTETALGAYGKLTATGNGNITITGVTAAKLADDLLLAAVTSGKISIQGASNQSFIFTEDELGAYGTVTATGNGTITVSGVTAAKLAADLAAVAVASGAVHLMGADGETFSLTQGQLAGSVTVTAHSGDGITLTNATGAGLASALGKLHVSGGGAIDVSGAPNETLTLSAANMTDISAVHTAGAGGVAITGAAAATIGTLLNKVFITGSGTASITFTDAATAAVSAALADSRQFFASHLNGSIEITNAAGKQTFHGSPGNSGTAKLITHIGDSTAITSTCDVLHVISGKAILIDFSSISANNLLWNLATTAKATALSGAGLVLDPGKYDVYVASVSGSDYVVYETAVDGSAYEAIKLVGAATPATLQMNAGILYL